MRELFQSLMSFFSLYQTLEGQQQRDDDRAFADASRTQAAALSQRMLDPEASGLLGDGRLGNALDADVLGLLDGQGMYLGWLDGQMLAFPGTGHLLCLGRTQSGKARDVVFPVLGLARDRSFVCVDVKNGELAVGSRDWRAAADGQPTIELNPFGVAGLPTIRYNPLYPVVEAVQQGCEAGAIARDKARILVGRPKSGSDGAWTKAGGNRLVATFIHHRALYRQDDCILSELWRCFNCDETEHRALLAEMVACDHPGISGRAGAMLCTMDSAPKQYQAYLQEAIDAVEAYEPHSALDRATRVTDFDFAELKRSPRSVFIILPSDKIDEGAQWISLVIDGLMETISRAAGTVPVTFILDEFPQLKPAPAVTRCLRLYASLGVQMYVFAQSRYAIEDVWGRAFTKELEDQASVLQILNCDDPQLIKDIELWSGFTTVVVRGFNVNGGIIENAGSGLSEQRRAVLQPENIRGIGPDQQLLRIAPCPHLFVAHRIPYFRMEPVKDRIRDVRAYHAGVAEFGGTSLGADGDDDEGC